MDNPDKNTLGGLEQYTKHGCLPQNESVSFGNMYKTMLASFLALPFSFMLGPVAFVAIIAVVVLSISLFIRGIIQQKKKSKGEVIDDGYIKASIIMPVILIIAFALLLPAVNFALIDVFSMDWRSNYSQTLFDYAEQNDGNFPPAENWCDVLVEFKTEHNEFTYKKEDGKDIRYALNKKALGLPGNVPDDMVLMFSSKPGWNQVGGSEIADGRKSIKVIFGDKHSEKIRKKHLSHLRWSIEDVRTYPAVNTTLLYSITLILLASSATVIFKSRGEFRRYWIFIIIICVSSMLLGAYFAVVAEQIYYDLNHDGVEISYWAGSVTGLLAGLAFALIMAKKHSKKDTTVSLVGFATVTGAITGIVALSFTHAFLMTAYVESNPLFMACGIPFGVFCGVGLGWISSGAIKLYNKKQEVGIGTEELES